jgi:transglutaminase-like putative cysteine protease
MLALLLALVSMAHARQVTYDLVPSGESYRLVARWDTAAGAVQDVRVLLDAQVVDGPRALLFDLKTVARETASSLRTWAARERVDLTVRARDGGVYVSATADTRAELRRVLARAEDARDVAYADALARHGMIELRKGLTADHARMAREHAVGLRPLALALASGLRTGRGAPESDVRVFAERALSFTQNIPYKAGGSAGVRTPVGVLVKNRGDCDSKTTLFLALLRAAYPDVPAALVYVPRHALAAIGLRADSGEASLKAGARTWLLAEPVGPRLMRLGEIGGTTRRTLGRAELREL